MTSKNAFLGLLNGWSKRWRPSADVVFLATALVIGFGTGLGAVLFRYLIQGVSWIGYTWIPSIIGGNVYVVLIPAVGGLLVGSLVFYFAREAKGHGVPEVMEAIALRGGRIRPRVAAVKVLASSITIGSGGSAGREGPIVQIGSSLGSSVGQWLKLSDDRISNLVACGAAAGISATFNAPIAGVFFALEVILGRFSVRYFSSVVISSVAASIVGRVAFGDYPAFALPTEYGVNSLWEFLFYPILGVLAAVIGVIYVRVLYGTEDVFDSIKRVPEWVKPAIGGTLLGLVALAYPIVTRVSWDGMPQIYNVGYDVIEDALAGQLAFSVVAILLVLKLVATSLTLGSGGSGGVFAPSLFMGAMLGEAFELGIARLFPGIPAPAGAYALLGMAALFAASAHAPMTAVLMLFELTGDYRLILPLMLTVVIATVLAQKMLSGESIYTMKLSRRGTRLSRGRDADILQGVTVGEVMSHSFQTVPMELTIDKLGQIFASSRHHGLMILDEKGKLWGVVTITDLDRAVADKRPAETTVAEIGTGWPNLAVAYPDESMGDALARLGARGFGRLPVVSREDPYHLVGLVWRQAITEAYNLARTRRSEIQSQTRNMQSRYEDGAEFVEIPIGPDDQVVGKTLAQISARLPYECILVSIRRNGRVIIPHGDTIFQGGDQVTAYVRSEDMEELYTCLHQPEEPALAATDDAPGNLQPGKIQGE